MSKILIMHQTITSHDAIGNDIEYMFKLLSRNNYCVCFAEGKLNKNVTYIDIDEVERLVKSENILVLYHHSIYWPLGEKIIQNAGEKANVVFRYHNITPPSFFAPYDSNAEVSCIEGRRQTDRFIKLSSERGYHWLSDSRYNAEDLLEVDSDRIEICAPFHKIEEWTKASPDSDILNRLVFDSRIKMMFVGRLAPNKNHKMLIEILRDYIANFGTNVRLYIIGKPDGGLYSQDIDREIRRYGLEPYIEFVGEITDSILLAYYLGTDVFLCTSNHEGFCVPVIEAQKLELPIIVKNSCAVPDTAGENQILLGENTLEYAAAIKLLSENKDYRNFLIESGKKNYYTNYSCERLEKIFIDFLKKYEVTV